MELTGGNTGKDTDNNSTCSEFDISITLTDLGLQNYKTVRNYATLKLVVALLDFTKFCGLVFFGKNQLIKTILQCL